MTDRHRYDWLHDYKLDQPKVKPPEKETPNLPDIQRRDLPDWAKLEPHRPTWMDKYYR